LPPAKAVAAPSEVRYVCWMDARCNKARATKPPHPSRFAAALRVLRKGSTCPKPGLRARALRAPRFAASGLSLRVRLLQPKQPSPPRATPRAACTHAQLSTGRVSHAQAQGMRSARNNALAKRRLPRAASDCPLNWSMTARAEVRCKLVDDRGGSCGRGSG
jgi:hypothetical protein